MEAHIHICSGHAIQLILPPPLPSVYNPLSSHPIPSHLTLPPLTSPYPLSPYPLCLSVCLSIDTPVRCAYVRRASRARRSPYHPTPLTTPYPLSPYPLCLSVCLSVCLLTHQYGVRMFGALVELDAVPFAMRILTDLLSADVVLIPEKSQLSLASSASSEAAKECIERMLAQTSGQVCETHFVTLSHHTHSLIYPYPPFILLVRPTTVLIFIPSVTLTYVYVSTPPLIYPIDTPRHTTVPTSSSLCRASTMKTNAANTTNGSRYVGGGRGV